MGAVLARQYKHNHLSCSFYNSGVAMTLVRLARLWMPPGWHMKETRGFVGKIAPSSAHSKREYHTYEWELLRSSFVSVETYSPGRNDTDRITASQRLQNKTRPSSGGHIRSFSISLTEVARHFRSPKRPILA